MAASREVFRRHSAAMRSSVLVTAGKTKVGYGEGCRKPRWKLSKTSWRLSWIAFLGSSALGHDGGSSFLGQASVPESPFFIDFWKR